MPLKRFKRDVSRSLPKHSSLKISWIINSVIKGKEPCIDLHIYDLEKAFDALWLEECMNDVFDSLSEENREIMVEKIRCPGC